MDIRNLIGEATEYDKKEKLEEKNPRSWLKSVSAFANGIGGALKGSGKSFDSLPSGYDFSKMAFTKLISTYYQRTKKDFLESDYVSFGLEDGNGVLTNAGALLADNCPIYQSRLFCTRWNGLSKSSGLQDALDDAEYSGSLISLLQEGEAFVKRNSHKGWFKTPDGRVELPEYPERSVTEGIVNALIHRDYMEFGSEVHIDIYDDRLEIYSPGGMLDGVNVQDRDIMSVPSRRRNPIIADVFSRLNYMERRGSGFKKIIDDYQNQYNYTEEMRPVFLSEYDSFFLTLKNLNYPVSKNAAEKGDKKATKKRGRFEKNNLFSFGGLSILSQCKKGVGEIWTKKPGV